MAAADGGASLGRAAEQKRQLIPPEEMCPNPM